MLGLFGVLVLFSTNSCNEADGHYYAVLRWLSLYVELYMAEISCLRLPS